MQFVRQRKLHISSNLPGPRRCGTIPTRAIRAARTQCSITKEANGAFYFNGKYQAPFCLRWQNAKTEILVFKVIIVQFNRLLKIFLNV